jgi:acyl-CoA synthetase (AMP-forming)/AMP-acid ligase II
VTISTLLEMASALHGDRVAVKQDRATLTYNDLEQLAERGSAALRGQAAGSLVHIGVNGPAVPVALFSAAKTGIPFVPLNYRLPTAQLHKLIHRLDAPVILADEGLVSAIGSAGLPMWETAAFLDRCRADGPSQSSSSGTSGDDGVAIVLFTSGTTSAPKGVLLRHANLLSYIFQSVDLGCARATDVTLVSTPPYHIAGIGAVLSNVYSGRRMVYLPNFTPAAWFELVEREQVTNAMVVPTMLARIVDHAGDRSVRSPSLRTLSYGGSRMPRSVLERALRIFPNVEFTNAYGLTETSATIAALDPDDHRRALQDPAVAERLESVGRPVSGVEAQVRDSESGRVLDDGQVGILWVRGPQVSGEYLGQGSALDAEGWFSTRDLAYLKGGYLYIRGRADDTIIRGGENIAPEEVEEELLRHPDVQDAGVVGLADVEWGEIIVAALVPKEGHEIDPDEVRDWCRARLRSSRTPDRVVAVTSLPRTALDKLARHELARQVATSV